MIRGAGPRPAAAGARRTGVLRDAAEDGPGDMALRHRRAPRSGAECRWSAPARAPRRPSARAPVDQIQVGGRRQLREPRAEPAACACASTFSSRPAGPDLISRVTGAAPLTRISSRTTDSAVVVPAAVVKEVALTARARHALDVDPVPVAVGEAPGDVAVRARDQQRRAGQRHAVQVERRPVGTRRGTQARVIPHRRHALAEVHVVGDECRAAGGQAPGHRPAVAAGGRRARHRSRRCRARRAVRREC